MIRRADLPNFQLARLRRGLLLFHPALLAAAIVADRFASWPAAASTLPRPLIVAMLGTITMVAIVRLIVPSDRIAALITGLLCALLLVSPILMLVYGALLLWVPLRAMWRRHQPTAVEQDGSIDPLVLGTFATTALLAIAAARVMGSGAIATPISPIDLPASGSAWDSRPNIYVLLLDGYPRSDTLSRTFNYDNGGFLSGLRDLGFEISENSRSNYNKTSLTLASMFNGAYIEDLMRIDADAPHQYRAIQPLINGASLLALMRTHGYKVWTASSPFSTATVESADTVVRSSPLNEFEVALIQNSIFGRTDPPAMRTLLGRTARAAVIDTLGVRPPSPDGLPRFSFVHVMSPHPPFVLGTPDPAEDIAACFPVACGLWEPSIGVTDMQLADYASGLKHQLDALNPLVIDWVRETVRADPSAVIVVMSDHGSRYSQEDSAEQFRTLFAARTPGVEDLFPDDVAPVNVIRRILSTYADAGLPPLEYRAWLSSHDRPLDMTAFVGP